MRLNTMVLKLVLVLAILTILNTVACSGKRINYEPDQGGKADEPSEELIETLKKYYEDNETKGDRNLKGTNDDDDDESNRNNKMPPNFQFIPTTSGGKYATTSSAEKQPAAKEEKTNHEADNSNSWTVFFILCVLGMYQITLNSKAEIYLLITLTDRQKRAPFSLFTS
jgi:hypothetical protein